MITTLKFFDWDDTVMFMPANIYAFNNQLLPHSVFHTLKISTGLFAIYRSKIGTDLLVPCKMGDRELIIDETGELKINLKDYSLVETHGELNSYMDFRGNRFRPQVVQAILEKRTAKCYDKFVESLQNQNDADHVFIITARGHSPEEIMEGLKFLLSENIIKFLPKLEHIFPCSSQDLPEKYRAQVASPSDAKALIINEYLKNEKEKMSKIDGINYIYFYEDDPKTLKIVEEKIQNSMNEHTIDNVIFAMFDAKNEILKEIKSC